MAGRGGRAPLSAAGGAHGRNSTPDQASRVKSGDHGGSMDVRADAARSNAQDLVANTLALSHPRDGYDVLILSDALITIKGVF